MKTTSVNLPANKKYSIIVPAAGMGTRMKSYGAKCLIEIAGKPLIYKQIDTIGKVIRSFEIILVCGFDAESVKKKVKQRKNVKVVENVDFETTNVVKSIQLGLEQTSYDDVIILYGDLVFNRHAIMAPFGSQSTIVIDKDDGFMKRHEVGLVCSKHQVTNFMYGLPQKWAQIAYLTGNELALARNITKAPQTAKWLGFELLNAIIDNGGVFAGYCPKHIRAIDLDSSVDVNFALETRW